MVCMLGDVEKNASVWYFYIKIDYLYRVLGII